MELEGLTHGLYPFGLSSVTSDGFEGGGVGLEDEARADDILGETGEEEDTGCRKGGAQEMSTSCESEMEEHDLDVASQVEG